MKVLICLTLVALLCCTVEGKKSKKGPKIQKQDGEPCSLPSGIPWGDCFQAVNCPSSPSLNCADGLRCCRPPKEDSSGEDTNASEGDTAYDKFLMDMKKYYP